MPSPSASCLSSKTLCWVLFLDLWRSYGVFHIIQRSWALFCESLGCCYWSSGRHVSHLGYFDFYTQGCEGHNNLFLAFRACWFCPWPLQFLSRLLKICDHWDTSQAFVICPWLWVCAIVSDLLGIFDLVPEFHGFIGFVPGPLSGLTPDIFWLLIYPDRFFLEAWATWVVCCLHKNWFNDDSLSFFKSIQGLILWL